MGALEKAKAIIDIDLDNLTDAFIYHAVYLNLSEFSTKFQMNLLIYILKMAINKL